MTHDAIETRTHRGWTIAIRHDADCESPRDCDTLGTFWAGGSRSRFRSPDDMPGSDVIGSIALDYGGHDWPSAWAALNRAAIALIVYRYEHGGVAYRTRPFHCPWDSGPVGVIFAGKAKVREEWGVKAISPKLRQRVENALSAEVDAYASWANGSCYGYSVTDPHGAETDAACWGFIGDPDESGLLDDARSEIDAMIAERARARLAQVKTLIRKRVPLGLRPRLLAGA